MTIKTVTVDLETDIVSDPEFVALMADDIFCAELWTAFANQDWQKVRFPGFTDAEVIAYRLANESKSDWYNWDVWGASFRGMGGVIAGIRNDCHNMNEDYINWYCSNHSIDANYGDISERVLTNLARLGWEPYYPETQEKK